MRHVKRFAYNLKHLVNNATAIDGLSPEDVSRKILIALSAGKNSDQDEKEFTDFIQERSIDHLVHFTHISNLKSILKFGLIPRIYLEEEVMRIGIRPAFSDNQRRDGFKEANCLSISYPNSLMFYSKRKKDDNSWAILFLNPSILVKHACQFSSSNNAAKSSIRETGIEGAKKLFGNIKLRKDRNLPTNYTTDPQAEVLELSVVPPNWINEIHVFSKGRLRDFETLAKEVNIPIKADERYYQNRNDYSHWSKPKQLYK